MTFEQLLIGALSVQVIVLLADLLDEYSFFSESGRYPSRRSIMFLSGIIAIYGVIQFGLFALVPRIEELSEAIQQLVQSAIPVSKTAREVGPALIFVFTAISFYASGLWDYLTHRFLHTRRLFFLHESHHLPNKMLVALPGMSVRPFAIVASLPPMLATIIVTHAALSLIGYQNAK